MFLFDWPKIYLESDGKAREIVRIFRMIVEKRIPENRRDPIYKYSQKDFSGESFMLHPEVLLYHSFKYKPREVAQYIALCSMRSTGAFLANREVRLDPILIPIELGTILQQNRLLYMGEDDYIHFLYEEVQTGDIH